REFDCAPAGVMALRSYRDLCALHRQWEKPEKQIVPARPCSAERAPPGHGAPEIVWPSGSEGDSSSNPAASAFVFAAWMMASTTHEKIPTSTNTLAPGPHTRSLQKSRRSTWRRQSWTHPGATLSDPEDRIRGARIHAGIARARLG